MRPRVHVLQHESFERPGTIENWSQQNSLLITRTDFFEQNYSLPNVSDFDLLVIMGGPMSVNGEDTLEWLKPEKKLISAAIQAEKKVVGICLGAQLIASVLGARVYPNRQKEIGWFEIEKTKEANSVSVVSELPDRLKVFHWHGETFDLPKGAIRIFRSEACEQQGFVVGSNIVALQFHLEVTSFDVLEFLNYNGHELTPGGPFIQTADQIKANLQTTEKLEPFMFSIMDNLLQSTASVSK